MKNRYFSKLPDQMVPGVINADGTPALGRCLIRPEDEVHFTSYEIQLAAGKQVLMASPSAAQHGECGTNHIYYCIDGQGEAVVEKTKESFTMTRDSALALPPSAKAAFTATSKCRIFVLHCQSNNPDPNLPKPSFRTLAEITETERDVDWTHGHSRRFFIRTDGFNISVHNTNGDPNITSPLWYKKNFEGVYWVRGVVKYSWDDDKSESGFDQMDQSDGDGFLILMDKNDPHKMHSLERSPEAICIFFPALTGNETHDFTSGSHSSY